MKRQYMRRIFVFMVFIYSMQFFSLAVAITPSNVSENRPSTCVIKEQLIVASDSETKSCSCRTCNQFTCCTLKLPNCSCETLTWSVGKNEKCSDGSESSLCCKVP